MNILIVSQYFYPENFRINQLCIDLRNRGHNITIFTGKPNYPEGKVFEGYCEKGFEVEEWENMKIYRCPLRGRKSGSFNLLKNYFSFVHNGKKYIKKLKQVNFDLIYIFEVSPMTVALPAIKLKKITQLPIIINIQDLWPDNIVAVTGIDNKLVVGLITKLVKYIYKRCDLILAASPSFV
ncbi:MAG: glycosyltransferase, partial [Erysipelotrichaceae bacterium]